MITRQVATQMEDTFRAVLTEDVFVPGPSINWGEMPPGEIYMQPPSLGPRLRKAGAEHTATTSSQLNNINNTVVSKHVLYLFKTYFEQVCSQNIFCTFWPCLFYVLALHIFCIFCTRIYFVCFGPTLPFCWRALNALKPGLFQHPVSTFYFSLNKIG